MLSQGLAVFDPVFLSVLRAVQEVELTDHCRPPGDAWEWCISISAASLLAHEDMSQTDEGSVGQNQL